MRGSGMLVTLSAKPLAIIRESEHQIGTRSTEPPASHDFGAVPSQVGSHNICDGVCRAVKVGSFVRVDHPLVLLIESDRNCTGT